MSLYALGIDPGMASVGIAIIEVLPERLRLVEAKVIRTQKANARRRVRAADDTIERSREIAARLIEIRREFKPSLICAESMSFPRSSSVAAKMAMCWGVVAGLAEAHGLPLLQATPQEIKRALTGDRTASKEAVQVAVVNRCTVADLRLSGIIEIPKTLQEHAFDAAAAVFACETAEAFRMARRLAAP